MHIGELIRQKVQEQGKSVVWLARELSCSRTNIYKICDKSSVDTDMLLRLSLILDYDFFSYYSNEFYQRKQAVISSKK